MTTNLKIGITALVGTGVAGGAGTAYYLTRTDTIKQTLINKGIKLIADDASENIWKIALKESKVASELAGTDIVVTDLNTLKSWCTKTYQISSNKEQELKKVEKLCLMPPTTMEAKLKKENKEFTKDWNAKLAKVKSEKLQALKTLDTRFSDIDTASNKEAQLTAWCNEQKPKDLIAESYEDNYQKVVDFCV